MYINRFNNLLIIRPALKAVLLLLISFYQSIVKPLFGSHARCRFQPSCSEYVKQSFEKQAPFVAFKLSIKRLLKCNPFGSYGYDPVPGDKK